MLQPVLSYSLNEHKSPLCVAGNDGKSATRRKGSLGGLLMFVQGVSHGSDGRKHRVARPVSLPLKEANMCLFRATTFDCRTCHILSTHCSRTSASVYQRPTRAIGTRPLGSCDLTGSSGCDPRSRFGGRPLRREGNSSREASGPSAKREPGSLGVESWSAQRV